jgi:hypothetical protein
VFLNEPIFPRRTSHLSLGLDGKISSKLFSFSRIMSNEQAGAADSRKS